MDIFKKSSEERKTVNEECLVVPYTKEVKAVRRVLSDAGMRIVRGRTSDDTRRKKCGILHPLWQLFCRIL